MSMQEHMSNRSSVQNQCRLRTICKVWVMLCCMLCEIVQRSCRDRSQCVGQIFRVSCQPLNETVSEAPCRGCRRPLRRSRIFFTFFILFYFLLSPLSVFLTTKPLSLWQVLLLKESCVTYLLSRVTSQNPMLSRTLVVPHALICMIYGLVLATHLEEDLMYSCT